MQNRYFYQRMKHFVKELSCRYFGQPFNIWTTSAMEDDIRREVKTQYPLFYENVHIAGREIHISSEFFKKYAVAMMFLPCMFTVKECYFYDLYIDNVPVGMISFKKNLDPCNYGYIVTVNPFEMCEFVKKAFEQAMEEVAELPEIPPAEQVRIAMNYGEVKRHEKKD